MNTNPVVSERLKNYRAKLKIKKSSRVEESIKKLRLNILISKKTKDYNLGTSLRSYIDPRIYYRWGKKINYDWRKYYSKALESKFSWVEEY